jgi:hypothetical protein
MSGYHHRGCPRFFWGGLRLGWLRTNATLAAQLRHRRAAMDLGGPAFLQRISPVLLADHFESTLMWRIDRLCESLEQARRAIAEEELDWEYRAPAGGPSLWLRLPGRSGERFAQRAAAAGAPVASAARSRCSPVSRPTGSVCPPTTCRLRRCGGGSESSRTMRSRSRQCSMAAVRRADAPGPDRAGRTCQTRGSRGARIKIQKPG